MDSALGRGARETVPIFDIWGFKMLWNTIDIQAQRLLLTVAIFVGAS